MPTCIPTVWIVVWGLAMKTARTVNFGSTSRLLTVTFSALWDYILVLEKGGEGRGGGRSLFDSGKKTLRYYSTESIGWEIDADSKLDSRGYPKVWSIG